MRLIRFILVFLSIISPVFAQNEKAPIQEKQVNYKDWTFKSIFDGKEIRLSDFIRNKKLVLIVYFAPWCPNWKHQAPITQRLYEKYKASGFDVIAVGEYDSVDAMRKNINEMKISFPVVYESDSREAKQKTKHYEYRKQAGDTRNWGSPWNIFIEPSKIEPESEILVRKTYVVNGELIEEEVENFIRQKLSSQNVSIDKKGKTTQIEVCDPNKIDSKKP